MSDQVLADIAAVLHYLVDQVTHADETAAADIHALVNGIGQPPAAEAPAPEAPAAPAADASAPPA